MLTEKVVIIYKFILKNKSHKKVEKDSWYTILISGHLEPTMDFLYSHINRDILHLKFQPNITMEILGEKVATSCDKEASFPSIFSLSCFPGWKKKVKKLLARLCL